LLKAVTDFLHFISKSLVKIDKYCLRPYTLK
jgi:hypothetical protein